MARTYIPVEVERRVRAATRNRCGYCSSPQRLVMARLEIEHIIPIAKQVAIMNLSSAVKIYTVISHSGFKNSITYYLFG
jgi:hypothetical protein